MQNQPDKPGVKRTRPMVCKVDEDTTYKVPEFFKLEFADLAVPKRSSYCYSAIVECETPKLLEYEEVTNNCLKAERKWLQHAANIVLTSIEQEDDDWSPLTNLVYHSREENAVEPLEQLTIGALLPIQFEPAHTLEMMRHCIDLISAAKNVVNPDQKTTFDVSDEPLYALSKQVQFALPDQYNLSVYLPLMGDLHTEQVRHNCYIRGNTYTHKPKRAHTKNTDP
jgi:hypothetical protein